MKSLSKEFFNRNTVKVAKDLLGKIIEYDNVSGMIVETEAYRGYPDEASHAAKRTPRSAIMFDTHGFFYVYFVYGNYFCLNMTCEDGRPGAVLVRALEPLTGIGAMAKRRGIRAGNKKELTQKQLVSLANGPGKLCQALGITKALNNTAVGDKMKVYGGGMKQFRITCATRVGIKKAVQLKWRFYIKDNLFVSGN